MRHRNRQRVLDIRDVGHHLEASGVFLPKGSKITANGDLSFLEGEVDRTKCPKMCQFHTWFKLMLRDNGLFADIHEQGRTRIVQVL